MYNIYTFILYIRVIICEIIIYSSFLIPVTWNKWDCNILVCKTLNDHSIHIFHVHYSFLHINQYEISNHAGIKDCFYIDFSTRLLKKWKHVYRWLFDGCICDSIYIMWIWPVIVKSEICLKFLKIICLAMLSYLLHKLSLLFKIWTNLFCNYCKYMYMF